jgi:hypothetical protein
VVASSVSRFRLHEEYHVFPTAVACWWPRDPAERVEPEECAGPRGSRSAPLLVNGASLKARAPGLRILQLRAVGPFRVGILGSLYPVRTRRFPSLASRSVAEEGPWSHGAIVARANSSFL